MAEQPRTNTRKVPGGYLYEVYHPASDVVVATGISKTARGALAHLEIISYMLELFEDQYPYAEIIDPWLDVLVADLAIDEILAHKVCRKLGPGAPKKLGHVLISFEEWHGALSHADHWILNEAIYEKAGIEGFFPEVYSSSLPQNHTIKNYKLRDAMHSHRYVDDGVVMKPVMMKSKSTKKKSIKQTEDKMSNQNEIAVHATNPTMDLIVEGGTSSLKLVAAVKAQKLFRHIAEKLAAKLVGEEHLEVLNTPGGDIVISLCMPLIVHMLATRGAEMGWDVPAAAALEAISEAAYKGQMVRIGLQYAPELTAIYDTIEGDLSALAGLVDMSKGMNASTPEQES